MKDSCYICCKDLSHINCTLDTKYVQHSWRPHFDQRKYIMFFSTERISTCVPCGKKLAVWNLSKNKLNMLKNRQITGKAFQLEMSPYPQIDKCVMCKQDTPYVDSDPINIRQYYLNSIGQCCSCCYMGMHNTSTSGDEEFYEDMYY